MAATEKVKPPTSHIVDTSTLKVGDHIYRRLNGFGSLIGYHHGVVTAISGPSPHHSDKQKEKVYKDYKLNINSTVKELKRIRREIKRQIRGERLHPDRWEYDMKNKEKRTRFQKYLWFAQILGWLDTDIRNQCVSLYEHQVKVMEMTRNHGIQENTLHEFLDGWDCRLVYYNTRKIDEILHASGTCHVERSSSIADIKRRINDVRRRDIYALLGANCEEFAVWLKTGIYEAETQLPSSHKVDASTLNVGDHIYRRLNEFGSLIGYHHGVVTEIPEPSSHHYDFDPCLDEHQVKVIEMTRNHGIQENTLHAFLNGWECRLVYYNTRNRDQKFHASGTCHVEPSSSLAVIKQRIIDVRRQKTNQGDVYALLGANCEEFAVWLKTGIYKGTETQLAAWDRRGGSAVQTTTQIGQSVIQAMFNGIDDATGLIIKKALVDTTKASAVEITENSIKEGAKITLKLGKETVKWSARGIGYGIGLAAGFELIMTAYRIYKCRKDYTYTKSDFWRDTGRGWIVAIGSTAIGLAFMPFGGWAIFPVVATVVGMNGFLNYCNAFDSKSQKEKVYKDYKLNLNSTVTELKRIRRKIRKQFRDERLHPDRWPDDMENKEKPKQLEKYFWFTQILEWLNNDIRNGCVSFDEEPLDIVQRSIELPSNYAT